jgi:NitT/TauT family transport system permease protein
MNRRSAPSFDWFAATSRVPGASLIWATLVLVALTGIWHLGSEAGLWNEGLLPGPADVFDATVDVMASPTFLGDLRQTVLEVLTSFTLGSLIGGCLGTLFWRMPVLGRAMEPYVVSFYAVPVVVFYPVMITLIGINAWSLITLSVMVVSIPVLLNTWVGLEGVPRVYFRLGSALGCTERQTFFRLALPAAVPQIFAGLRIAAIFSIISIIAMEFLLAPSGLGFRVRYEYQAFRQPQMYAYIVLIFVLAIAFATSVRVLEARLIRRRGGS